MSLLVFGIAHSGLWAETNTDESSFSITTNQLIEAKLKALRERQVEQEKALASAQFRLLKEEAKENKLFDSNAYLSLSIRNSAPVQEYRLDSTEILIDGKRFARGGKRNHGLPRKTAFFRPIQPGCHEITIKATYTRLKNTFLETFQGQRVVQVERRQTFVAKNGYRVEIDIEGLEVPNTFLNLYRGPSFRFNKSVRPNFLPGSPLVSLDEIFNQGRVHIDYLTEDDRYQVTEKHIRIDQKPVEEKPNDGKERSVLYDAPLAAGRHTLSVVLVFGEKTWITGGPVYKSRLKFDRVFYVISGQTTIINLTGLPSDGFRSSEGESRYARAQSRIISTEYPDFFPEDTCKEIKDKAAKEKLKNSEQSSSKSPPPAGG